MNQPNVWMVVQQSYMSTLESKKINFWYFSEVVEVVEDKLLVRQLKIVIKEVKLIWEAPNTCWIKCDPKVCYQLIQPKAIFHPGQSLYSHIVMVVSIKVTGSHLYLIKTLNFTWEDQILQELIWNIFNKSTTWKLQNKSSLQECQQEPWLRTCGPIISKYWLIIPMLYQQLLTQAFLSMIQLSQQVHISQH